MRIDVIDLEFQSTPRVIASYLLEGPEGLVLIECGPGSTLPTLVARLEERGHRPADVRHVLVTHIHLDHAGAAGWWAQQGATVYVHPYGAPHLVDPSRLLSSAERIYGDRMQGLWGEVLPAPEKRVVAVGDGEVIRAGGLEIVAVETPGHARHHHAYRLGDALFSGDSAAIRLPMSDWIDLPAPPPEFDLEAWLGSVERLRGARPAALYLTHFGPVPDAGSHLGRLAALLPEHAAFVRAEMERGLERGAMIERYRDWLRERAVPFGVDETLARAYEIVNPRSMSVDGIGRYWRRRSGG